MTTPRKPGDLPSIKALREVLAYDPDSGALTWRKTVNIRAQAGQVAGCLRRDGFRVVRYLGKRYLASRLAWALHFGEWPLGCVSHRNGDNSDDSLGNLQLTDTRGIHANRYRPDGDSKTGHLGVILLRGRWVARFRNKRIGTYDTPEQAAAAYWRYKQALGVLYRPADLLPVSLEPKP